ncbi:MAG: FAD-dependent oxidoreductase [Clostridium sp.]|uniref:NAD(P)/FAD-dependent oxidoreductase n=1 Tax=Clostridium sp. TaxID=1506 RepID=UPI0025B8DCCC|nr:NAD(P)/FAD-dependent oxidoreductase [Clostridium sp.]MCH3963948.1 FAD-dependent oxidoreductase [Clostridium sp.]MCI1716149.1 FAD-dependent oxidoreductase [Clostridium sp.]MCI1800611.1 FAD-dependent oxidoreductase [Clostridium sp.]MCI1814326.1 FAD-dependent oxidoreductase [Clostridium sp.]MCI1871225.1 FAD-dependent oxidoreductase [Clostridium sp.]
MYDIVIIGAGAVGCAIARELSKYKLKICILEKNDDVSCGASKANSGIVHGGYSDEPGTLKAKLCIRGNRMYESLNRELNFGYRETGSLVLAFNDEEKKHIEKLYDNGIKNGVDGMEIIDGKKVLEMEPHVNKRVKWALYCKNAGVCSPYEMTIALAENAVENGVDLKLGHEVTSIVKKNGTFQVSSGGEKVESRYIINAAGAYSDRISDMVGLDYFTIVPRKGEYIIFNKDQSYLVNSVIFQVPTEKGKGILVTTTYHGNLMIGPNAQEVSDRGDVSTDEEILKYIVETAKKSVSGFNMKKAITSFAGIRPTSSTKDFIIEETEVRGFINVAGIDSPGITSSPAIALKVVDVLYKAGLKLDRDEKFNPFRKPIIVKKDGNFRGDIDSEDPEKHIICRCEKVTESEIVDALHRTVKTDSIDGIKRRTRAGMGMCQGMFCGPRVRKIIARELKIPEEQVKKRGPGSSILPKRASRVDIMNIKK